MTLRFRPYNEGDLSAMCAIWNEVVEAGNAFPQVDLLDVATARKFFGEQTLTTVADLNGTIYGLYILHPNNVGRTAHVANASYAVTSASRGVGLGRELVKDSLAQAARLGFRGLQFNAVLDTNHAARHLYEDLGFTHVGVIPGGFIDGSGQFVDTHIYYKHCFSAPEAEPASPAAPEAGAPEDASGVPARAAAEVRTPVVMKSAPEDKAHVSAMLKQAARDQEAALAKKDKKAKKKAKKEKGKKGKGKKGKGKKK